MVDKPLDKLADIFNFCYKSSDSFAKELSKAGVDLLQIYKIGIYKHEFCAKGMGRN
jgi:hypothetical protein